LRVEARQVAQVAVGGGTLEIGSSTGRWDRGVGFHKRLDLAMNFGPRRPAGNAWAGDERASGMLAALKSGRGDIRTLGLFGLGAEVEPTPIPPADPADPPAGAWHRDDGMTAEFGASTRNIGTAIGMIFVAAIWNGVSWGVAGTGARVLLAAAGLLPLAEGEEANAAIGAAMVLFSAPFLALGVWLIFHAAMYVGGRVVVSQRGEEVSIFTGVGSIGKTLRVSVSAIASVEEHVKVSRGKHGPNITRTAWIRNRDGSDLKVGDLLSARRRVWVIGMLRRLVTG
jgi:hypothetical protein